MARRRRPGSSGRRAAPGAARPYARRRRGCCGSLPAFTERILVGEIELSGGSGCGVGAAGWHRVAKVAGYLGDRHSRVLGRGAAVAVEEGVAPGHGVLIGDYLHPPRVRAFEEPSAIGVVVVRGGGVELAVRGAVALPGDGAAKRNAACNVGAPAYGRRQPILCHIRVKELADGGHR